MLNLEAVESLVPKLGNENKSGEYYITDLVGMAVAEGMVVRGLSCGSDPNLLGINNPAELAASEELRRRASWRNGWRPAWPCTARAWSVWARM